MAMTKTKTCISIFAYQYLSTLTSTINASQGEYTDNFCCFIRNNSRDQPVLPWAHLMSQLWNFICGSFFINFPYLWVHFIKYKTFRISQTYSSDSTNPQSRFPLTCCFLSKLFLNALLPRGLLIPESPLTEIYLSTNSSCLLVICPHAQENWPLLSPTGFLQAASSNLCLRTKKKESLATVRLPLYFPPGLVSCHMIPSHSCSWSPIT